MHRYAVTYRPAAGSMTVWLVIESVPADVDPAAVEEALQGWRQWPEWMRRVGLGGVVKVAQVTGMLARRLDGGELGDTWRGIEWAELSPESRTLTVPLPGDLYGLISRQARSQGLTLREWAETLLRRAAGEATRWDAEGADNDAV